MKTQIPLALIFLRLITGLTILWLSFIRPDNYEGIVIVLLTFGLLTDVFDGIIARRLNVSTKLLRRLDSSIDQIFFVSVSIASYVQCPDFFKDNYLKLAVLLGFEGLTYVISFLKFGKEVATHSIGAKVWTLLIFSTLVQVILQCQSVVLFEFCFWVGLVTRLEIISILLILKKWTNDVPTVYHSIRLRQNKEIRRHKLFNG